MATFTLTWTPAGGINSINQTAKYRDKGSPTWLTSGFSPANPLSAGATTTSKSGLLDNNIYEFQVETLCDFGGPTPTATKEEIVYACIGGFSYASVNPGELTPKITGLSAFVDLNFAKFYVYDSTGTTLQATSPNVAVVPITQHTFTGLSAGNHIVKVQYGAIVNGVQEFSSFGISTCRYTGVVS